MGNVDPRQAGNLAKELLEVDVLLGNWECVVGKNEQELASSREAMYATATASGKVVRIGIDRALGCTYPEDYSKGPEKLPVLFEFKNIEFLRTTLQTNHRWCFGNIEDKDTIQSIMRLKLDEGMVLRKLKNVSLKSIGLLGLLGPGLLPCGMFFEFVLTRC